MPAVLDTVSAVLGLSREAASLTCLQISLRGVCCWPCSNEIGHISVVRRAGQ